MRPSIPNPDHVLSVEPTSDEALRLQANAADLPLTTQRQVHGLFSKRHRLPSDCKRLAGEMEAIREQLEAAVAEKHGQVGILHAALIDSVLTHHKRLRLLERWLVRPKHVRQKPWEAQLEGNSTGEIELADRMRLLKEESAASDARAKAIRDLGLGAVTADEIPWATVFAGMAQAAAAKASTVEASTNGGS